MSTALTTEQLAEPQPMVHERNLFVALVGVLLGFGTLMVHSASITSRPTEFEQVYLSRHVVFMGVGLCAAVLAAWIPPRTWLRLAPALFWLNVLLLGLLLVPGIGTRVNGAQRWFRYAGFSLQPSELAKITLPLYVCCILQKRRDVLRSWFRGLLPPAFPILAIVPLVLFEPDLGTSLFLAATGGIALWIGNWPLRNFTLAALSILPALGYLVALKPYQLQRIKGFLTTWSDWSNAPYQLKQSLMTLGAGGVLGAGLGKGFQKLSFLPEANTDFVFAVIGEELGLVGTLTVIALWVGLYAVGLRLLSPLDEKSFAYHAGFSLLTQLVLQAMLNMAVVTALVPPKGIPHPLLSYGGSNLVVTLIAVGIVVSMSRAEEQPHSEG